MQILKKFLILSAVVLFAAPGLHAGSSFMNGVVLKPWKFSLNACGSFFIVNTNRDYANNDPDLLAIPDIGFRVGLPGNWDFGFKVFKLGMIADVKYIFMEFFPFRLALDVEASLASRFAFGAAIIMDLEISSFLAVYLSARWRYPALYDIDPTRFSEYNFMPSGMMFLCRFGIELFRYSVISFGVEGGIATSWTTTDLGYNMGALITWHIN